MSSAAHWLRNTDLDSRINWNELRPILGLLGSVKSILPAGAAIPLESERKLRENFPELRSVSSLYGTSEIGIIARTDTNNHIGYLMPLVEVKVCLKQRSILSDMLVLGSSKVEFDKGRKQQ